jgi:Asp/Glu/hydantoin racemase
VTWLRDHLPRSKLATGIFQSSITCCLDLLEHRDAFGIVTTGDVWEQLLSDAVRDFLGSDSSWRFAGVESTGLNATDLHDAAPAVVREKIKKATCWDVWYGRDGPRGSRRGAGDG